MSFLIHLERTYAPEDCAIHPGLTGYLAILHDEYLEKTVYVGFLGPHDLLPARPGAFPGITRLVAWLTRGVAIHDQQSNQDTLRWLARALDMDQPSRPVLIMRNLPDLDMFDWPPHTHLDDLRAHAEADLLVMELMVSVGMPGLDASDSSTRF